MADSGLSAREREILDVIYRLGEATATQVIAEMKEPPSRSAVRTFLRILEQKRHIGHRRQGREFVYRPTKSKQRMGQEAVQHVLQTFFSGSLSGAVASHFAHARGKIAEAELRELARMIDAARQAENQE